MVYSNNFNQVRIGVRPWVDSGIDASANLFFSTSGLSDTTQKNAVNVLVKDLKRFGLWTKIKAFYPFVGGTADSHKWNLKDPRDSNDAYRLTFSGGWTHTSMGIKSNGSNTSADTFLNLSTVFGPSSSNHNIGIYINENPVQSYSVRGFRNDIGATDGTNVIDIWVGSSSAMYFRDIPSNLGVNGDWVSYQQAPTDVTGLNELKRYSNKYYTWTKNGAEVQGTRNITTTVRYNPNGKVYIGSSSSLNRYSTAYITSPLDTIETYLMYIAVQRFNSSLYRQIGTSIAPLTISTTTATQSLVTSGLKVSFDASSLTRPPEGATGSNSNWYHGVTPGNYFMHGQTWNDDSGNGNHGTFWVNTNYEQRAAEYFIDDLGIPEVRFRDQDNTPTKTKPYQYSMSADALTTTYKGSDTGTFTFGGWIKMTTVHNYFLIMRGDDSTNMGGAWSIQFSGSIGGRLGISLVASGGAVQGTAISPTIFKANTWYNIYCVWKPGSYIKYYINGVLQVTNAMTHTTLRTASGNIGWLIGGGKLGTYHQRGIFGALQVYDRELSAAEIKQNFDAGKYRYNVTFVEDSDAQSFITAAGITDTTQASAVNTLVTSLKTAGIWTKMRALYPFIGGTADSHKFNLKDPRDIDTAYRLVFNGGWTHTGTGALPNGTTAYADSKFITSQVYPSSVTNIHVSYYSRTNSIISEMIGMQDDTVSQGSQVYLQDTGTVQTYSALNTDNNWVRTNNSSPSVGFYSVSRTSMSLLKGYKNGILQGSNTTTSAGSRSTLPIVIGGAIYKFSSPIYYYGNKEVAFASIGDGLTDAESIAFYTAVQAFQTSLGRQV